MATERMQELRDSLLDLNEQIQTIQAQADAEKRDLTDEEDTKINELFASFKKTEKEIERRTRIENQTAKLMEPAGRKTEPQMPEAQNRGNLPDTRPNSARIITMEDKGKWGWRSIGDFATGVRAAVRGNLDPRLVRNAPTTYSSEGVGEDGGFAVPPDFRATIMEKVMGETSLMGRTDQMTTASNSLTFPKDETTPWQTSGGVLAYWDGEADQLTQSKVQLKEHTLRTNKMTALVPVTEELNEDAGALDGYLRRKVPEKMNFKLNLAIVQGTGTGQPTGILNANSLVSVAKGSGQAADTLIFANIVDMYSRMYSACIPNSVWLINQDILPQLLTMQFPGTGTAVPAYLPPGGLSQAPYGTLMGRPVIMTEACETLGDQGDIFFVDLTQYLTLLKTGGVRSDVSMHLWFDYDTLAYRFIFRVGGEPWWNSTIAKRDGSNTLSWAITLDARA